MCLLHIAWRRSHGSHGSPCCSAVLLRLRSSDMLAALFPRRFMYPHTASQKLRTRSSQRHGKLAFSHDGERGGEALQRDFMISDSRLWDRWASLLLVVSTGHPLSTLTAPCHCMLSEILVAAGTVTQGTDAASALDKRATAQPLCDSVCQSLHRARHALTKDNPWPGTQWSLLRVALLRSNSSGRGWMHL